MIKFRIIFVVVVLCTLSGAALAIPNRSNIRFNRNTYDQYLYNVDQDDGDRPEQSANFWNNGAQVTLLRHLHQQQNINVARNVIMFLGDGMSLPTVTAARTYYGQQHGKTGEESRLSFEEFPYVGLSKTYCVDQQVADSACSATAYLCGIKANYATIGVTAKVKQFDCEAGSRPTNHIDSIATWAQEGGKATGIVTNTRITHASPAGAYAHTANRDWECDADVPATARGINGQRCQDIASQLIFNEPGRNFNVILGGGISKFIPDTEVIGADERGERKDGNNLIKAWQRMKGTRGQYVTNKEELLAVNVNETDHVFGLFAADHLNYNLDRDERKEPSLAEMTASAIRMLQGNENGFFLFVEGGRIDHAHHDNLARKALDETVQFSEAIRRALEMTSEEETLIVVTSDHAHTMSISGYSPRGSDILGLAGELSDIDQKPYSTLNYATGPKMRVLTNGSRSDLIKANFAEKDFQYPALVPLKYSSHGGEDVGVFAIGPWSHLFSGIYDQNAIAHFMAFASCIGDALTTCNA